MRALYRHVRHHHKQAARQFRVVHKRAHTFLKRRGVDVASLRQHAVRTAGAAGIASTALVGPAYAMTIQQQDAQTTPIVSHATAADGTLVGSLTESRTLASSAGEVMYGPDATLANKAGLFTQRIQRIVSTPGPVLQHDQEVQVEQLIQDSYGIPAKAELEGIRLNAVYGVMAGEQHLPLYPGDTLANHGSDPTKQLTGMVPGLPSWGYFAPSKAALTQKDIERERYYIAAQTFLSPTWKSDINKHYNWFKYRKMVVVNPETGSAMVVVIGDAGPSPFLKRAFGGSNEVMMGLDLGLKRKGAVYAFFVDDPEDKIPLGPVGQH